MEHKSQQININHTYVHTDPNTPLYVTSCGLMKEMVSRSNLTYTNLFYKLYGLSTSYNEHEISLITNINKNRWSQLIQEPKGVISEANLKSVA